MMEVKEGDVVMITGKMRRDLHGLASTAKYGTIWLITKDKQILVLLPDGNFFHGAIYEVAPIEEQA